MGREESTFSVNFLLTVSIRWLGANVKHDFWTIRLRLDVVYGLIVARVGKLALRISMPFVIGYRRSFICPGGTFSV